MKQQKEVRYILGPLATEFSNVPTGTWRTTRPVIDTSRCTLCRQCTLVCPTDVIVINPESSNKIEILYDYCKGCGICERGCVNKCIVMEKENEKK